MCVPFNMNKFLYCSDQMYSIYRIVQWLTDCTESRISSNNGDGGCRFGDTWSSLCPKPVGGEDANWEKLSIKSEDSKSREKERAERDSANGSETRRMLWLQFPTQNTENNKNDNLLSLELNGPHTHTEVEHNVSLSKRCGQ